MNRVVIQDYSAPQLPCHFQLDLTATPAKHCTGCWSCWIKTPGNCIYSDLNDFYRAYLAADEVVIFTKASQEFISSSLKTLFDRMLPLFLPYISYRTGESMHLPRYEAYPDIRVYYEGEFSSEANRRIYEEYLHRAFYQFYSKNICVQPISQFTLEGAAI